MEYNDTHREIVEDCKKGVRRAQFELYQLYSQAMYNVCLRIVKNEMDAEDLLQNSFVDVFTKLHTFRYQSSVGAWIKRVVVNNCINFLKKKKLYFEEIDERLSNQSDPPEPGQEPPLSVETIENAISQLPDGYRVVFSLYLMEGYDHQEIAEILNVSVATSKSQYSRARKRLRELLLDQSMEA